jgi:hypothetical protein
MAALPAMQKFLYAGLMVQMTLWIGWTAVAGAIVGTIVTAIARRRKPDASASA